MSGQAAELILYHRYGCHLCEEMLERLQDLAVAWGFRLVVTDVDADSELVRRYNDKVPVLEGGGLELCRYVLDENAVKAYVSSAESRTGT